MPLDIYLGAAVGVIILVLLASLFRRRPAPRRALQKSTGTDQLTIQLSRVADALERITLHLEGSPPRIQPPAEPSPRVEPPRVEQPPEPGRNVAEQSATEDGKNEDPAKPRVNLSMFGR